MMEFIEEYFEQINKKIMIQVWGEHNFHLFSRYCLGGEKPYVIENGQKRVYKLTQVGLRKLHELRKTLTNEKYLKYQKSFNRMIAFTGSALAFLGTMGFLSTLGIDDFSSASSKLIFGGIAIIILIGTVGFMLTNFNKLDK